MKGVARKLKRFAVNLAAFAIRDRERRHAFRERFFPESRIYRKSTELLNNFENAVRLAGHPLEDEAPLGSYSLGVVTYNRRFETFFKPLIRAIRAHSGRDVVVAVNGVNGEDFDEEYRREMLNFLSEYPGIYPRFSPRFRGLAKLWNDCLINSPTEGMLLLNDDVMLHREFWRSFETALAQSRGRSFKINGSWSHVFLNRREVDEIGWFDERLLSMGWEDHDFEMRYWKRRGERLPHIVGIGGVDNLSSAEGVLENQRQKSGKYSDFNKTFWFGKFEVTDREEPYRQLIPDAGQYPYEKFYWEHRDDL